MSNGEKRATPATSLRSRTGGFQTLGVKMNQASRTFGPSLAFLGGEELHILIGHPVHRRRPESNLQRGELLVHRP